MSGSNYCQVPFGGFLCYTYGMKTMNHRHKTESGDACGAISPVMANTIRLIGDMWTLMIIYNLMDGPRRFGELLEALGNISPKTLSQRLKMLEEVRFVERRAFIEIPPRVEYNLTDKGKALLGIIEAIRDFGLRYLSDVEAPSEACEQPQPAQ